MLVKVAYYASDSARFLPKLCSNYACFSKLCCFLKSYTVHKLHKTSLKIYFINPAPMFWISNLSSELSRSFLNHGCKFTALDSFGVAAAILKRAPGERLRSLGLRYTLPVPFHRIQSNANKIFCFYIGFTC